MSFGCQECVYKFLMYAPSLAVAFTFLPCGLVFGYTISCFVAERNSEIGLIIYGPLILGAAWGLVTACVMFLVKSLRERIIFWHVDILLAANAVNLLASCFYFATGYDDVGAYIAYVAQSMGYIAALSFLHTIPGKNSRATLITCGFGFYLIGIAAAVSAIGKKYVENVNSATEGTTEAQLAEGIYINFAATYMTVSIVILIILVALKVSNFFGTVECYAVLDNEFRIANSNGTIFEKRESVIKRVKFFYVTGNQQWYVTMLLLYAEAVQYALFIYFFFWFTMNKALQFNNVDSWQTMYWIISIGGVAAAVSVVFFSVKVIFVASKLILILLTVLTMVTFPDQKNVIIWFIFIFFGVTFANLKVVIVEVSHYRFTEILIYASYVLNMLSTSVVYYYFVSNDKNSYFHSVDSSTLMAQGFVFMIISSLLALVVGMKVPRTHRTSLFDIQYELLGIIFHKHQIEQLNMLCLNDGTIPTISKSTA